MTAWRVGLIYNLKKNVKVDRNAPGDALAEYDSVETVQALQAALEAGGHEVIHLEADESLLDTVRHTSPDICFNIAEGLRGDARESHVPALMEMLGIPYTASKVLGHAISLDKAATKRIWRDSGLPTPPFQVFQHHAEPIDIDSEFPLFVKPVHEGTGMGINGSSICRNEKQLRRQVRSLLETYRQPALVEGFLPGREYTVGILGNRLLPGEAPRSEFYDGRGYHLFPVLEIDPHHGAGKGLYNVEAKSYLPGEAGAPLYLCPADIPLELETELKELTISAFEAIDALDVSRVDFRMGLDGKPYLMEINTLPGLNPVVSDLCIMASAEGLPYTRLINEILQLAASRYVREGKLFTLPYAVSAEQFQPEYAMLRR